MDQRQKRLAVEQVNEAGQGQGGVVAGKENAPALSTPTTMMSRMVPL